MTKIIIYGNHPSFANVPWICICLDPYLYIGFDSFRACVNELRARELLVEYTMTVEVDDNLVTITNDEQLALCLLTYG
jgi:hypothetical protein